MEMQLESLQERLHLTQLHRPPPALPAGGEDGGGGPASAECPEELLRQLEQVRRENSALRTTAARLSRALAAVMQRVAGPGGGDGKARCTERAAAAAAGVIEQLSAVERMLSR
jgi:hypothetical protein